MKRPDGIGGAVPPRRPEPPQTVVRPSGGRPAPGADTSDRAAASTAAVSTEPRVTETGAAAPASLDREPSARQLEREARAAGREARRHERRAARERRRAERGEVRRFTRVSRRRRAIALGAGISLASLVGGVAVVTLSPLMSLTTIEVTGASRLDPAAIVEALDEHVGTPLAFLAADEIAADLADFTLVRSFATEIVPPNTLIVRIVERAPIGARETPAGVESVDAAGVVIEVTDAAPEGVPLIEVPADDEGTAFAAVADVLVAVPKDLVARIASVSATTRDDVTFELRESGHVVIWGDAERSAQKLRVLNAALTATDQAVRWAYDVSAPDSLVVREAD